MQVWAGCKGPRTPGIIIHLDARSFLIGEPGWSICASNHAVYKQGRGHYPRCVSRHCSLIKAACREAICECSYPNAISITTTWVKHLAFFPSLLVSMMGTDNKWWNFAKNSEKLSFVKLNCNLQLTLIHFHDVFTWTDWHRDTLFKSHAIHEGVWSINRAAKVR